MELALTRNRTTIIDDDCSWVLNFGRIHFDGRYVRLYLHSRWHNRPNRYVYLHKVIAGHIDAGKKIVVDHINRNPLDNRKENLRIVPQSINGLNKAEQRNKTGFFGVVFCPTSRPGVKRSKPWRSEVKVNGKRRFLGYFKTAKEASSVATAARGKE